VGWTGGTGDTTVWPTSGTPIITWGGDNTGPGGDPTAQENVYVNVTEFKSQYPANRYLVIECRGNWYGTQGLKPVLLTATVYDSGTVTPSGFGFTVTGYTTGRFIEGVSVFVNSSGTAGTELGTLMGYLVIDTTDNTAQFRNDLTGIS
jgi:hypothetical protein